MPATGRHIPVAGFRQARPDPTNAWIGAGAAACGYLARRLLQRMAEVSWQEIAA